VVLPKLSVLDVVETLSLPIVPVVVVLPKLSVLVVVDTFCPSHVPDVVVLPKLSVREVVLQAACDRDMNVSCPAIINVAMASERIFIFTA
jgi:hypothetical protein